MSVLSICLICIESVVGGEIFLGTRQFFSYNENITSLNHFLTISGNIVQERFLNGTNVREDVWSVSSQFTI